MDLKSRLQDIQQIASESRSAATRAAYDSDLKSFYNFAEAAHIDLADGIQPGVLCLYLDELHKRGLTPATIARRATAIRAYAAESGAADPFDDTTRAYLRGLKRRSAGTQQKQARPLSLTDIDAIVSGLGNTVMDARDRALLIIGWFGALRRSEVAALNLADVEVTPAGLRLHIRRSKTDQYGSGAIVALPALPGRVICPVEAWLRWERLRVSTANPAAWPVLGRFAAWQTNQLWAGDTRGRISARAVCAVIVKRARAAGLSGVYSGHSLRAGFVTECAARGVPEWAIQRHTRHKTSTSLRRYIRSGGAFRADENAIMLLLGGVAQPDALRPVESANQQDLV